MKKGIFVGLMYYSAGACLTVLSYFLADNSYAHGPSLYHMVGLLVLLIGFVWFLLGALQFVLGTSSSSAKGTLLVHIIVLSGLIVYLSNILTTG